MVGKVLAVRELEKRKGTFEHRVQYYNLDVNTREEIIRFILKKSVRVVKGEIGLMPKKYWLLMILHS